MKTVQRACLSTVMVLKIKETATMKAWVAIVAGLLAAPVFGMEFRSQLLEIKLPDVTLRGTFEQPLTTAPVPVALIIAGSGPTDRDGNNHLIPGANNSLKLLAQHLASQGIASLRFDKRGVGESVWARPDESALRLDTFVNDIDAWLAELERRGLGNVTLIGHSEGALLAILAAQRRPVGKLILIAGAGRPADVLIAEQLQRQAPQWLAEHFRIAQALKAGQRVADVPAALQSLYRPSVQPYMQSWLQRDPSVELAKLKLPVLSVSGSGDRQVGAVDADALGRVAGVRSVRITDMNHVLKSVAADDDAGQRDSYSNPALPLASALVPELVAFIRGSKL